MRPQSDPSHRCSSSVDRRRCSRLHSLLTSLPAGSPAGRLPSQLAGRLPDPMLADTGTRQRGRPSAPCHLVWLATCLAALPGVAHAQAGPGGNIDLQGFRPAIDSRGLVTVNGSDVLGHLEPSFGLVTSWGRNVLRLERDDNQYRVDHIVTPTLVGAVGLRLSPVHLELGLSVPFAVMAGDRDPDSPGAPGGVNDAAAFRFDGQGLGDIGLHAKLRLLDASRGPRVGVAVIGSAWLPTAAREQWLGGDSVTAGAQVVVDREFGPVHVAVNAGLRGGGGVTTFRDDMTLSPDGRIQPTTGQIVEVGATVPVGVGIAYALAPRRVSIVGEVFGQIPLAGENFFPVEAIGGLKVYLAKNSFFTLGAGTGLARAAGGSPDVRAFLGIVFEPGAADRDGDGLADDADACPDDPEDYDAFQDADGCPELDNDRDGILDADDQCPLEPEDRDGTDDDDGCPEGERSDRDGDGIMDEVDDCPDDPEDFDGFEDADGCPDPDNDGDQILDIDDLCPDDPEDRDGFEDGDGCPDLDNDGDQILDIDDECPLEKEIYNLVDDDDGCPDRGKLEITDIGIVILDKIHFEYNSAVIKRQSFPILNAVAKSLQTNPDIARLEVGGHTDERGSAAYNLALSRDRAAAVRQFLIDAGVEAGRLDAEGYGEAQPLDRRHNQEAWAINRRVEFVIVKRTLL